jgi:hypothetical protein
MTTRRGDDNQLLAPKVLLRLMTYLANLDFPSGWSEHTEELKEDAARGTGIHQGNKPELSEVIYDPGEKPQFIKQLQEATQRYWPNLWKNEEQACQVLKRIRALLRRFWLAPDQYARDWYIHRARHAVQRFRVQQGFPQKLETTNEVLHLNARIEDLLDNLPVHNPFEEALYELQRRALIPSKRPLFCPNTNCKKRYFFSERKGTKYCSPECFQADSGRPSKRASWHTHKNEWRKR